MTAEFFSFILDPFEAECHDSERSCAFLNTINDDGMFLGDKFCLINWAEIMIPRIGENNFTPPGLMRTYLRHFQEAQLQINSGQKASPDQCSMCPRGYQERWEPKVVNIVDHAKSSEEAK